MIQRKFMVCSIILLQFIYVELAISAEKRKPELITSYMTSGEQENKDELFERSDKNEFKHGDNIFYFANFTWQDIEKSGGHHKTVYKWYSNGKLIGAPKWNGSFKTAPWEVHSYMWAATLGYGSHKIELYLGGKLVDTKEFSVIK